MILIDILINQELKRRHSEEWYIVVAYGMVQTTNADKASLTGFEKENISIESLTKQMQTLFPEVEKVEVHTVETVNEQKKTEKTRSFQLTVSKKLSSTRESMMEEWLKELYDGP